MTDKRRGLGRGLGALIPNGTSEGVQRPVDVFFPDQVGRARPAGDMRPSAVSETVRARTAVAERHGATADRDDATPDTLGDQTAGTGASAVGVFRAAEPAASARGDSSADDADLVPVPGARFAEIPVGAIAPNARQPRQVFDDDELDELAASVREVGVLQPIVVRPQDAADGTGYELIMGERRWRAAERAGLATVPAIVRLTSDGDMLRNALLENLHRAQLNPLEEAAAYQQLLEDFACTHEELATRVARSRPQISNTIRLLKLPPTVQRRVAAGVLSAGHSRALLALADGAAMERLAQRIVAEGLSVRATEEIVALGNVSPEIRPRRRPQPDPALGDLASRLSDRFDTRVQISLGQRKGRIAIEFATVDDLHRILDVISPGLDNGTPAHAG